jgi:hypothetical protein
MYLGRVQLTTWLYGHVEFVTVPTCTRGVRERGHVATWILTRGHMATWSSAHGHVQPRFIVHMAD